MAVNAPTVTSSFGANTVTAPAKGNSYVGTIEFTAIPSTMQIIGQKGSVVIVDQTTSVSLSSTDVEYSAVATPYKAECAGLYNVSKSKIMDMTAGDTASNYKMLLKITDQYGKEVSAATAASDANLVLTTTGGITGVGSAADLTGATKVTVNNVDYVAVPLTGSAVKAGTFIVNLVNKTKGLLLNQQFTVAEGTVVKSFSVSATDAIYAGQKNTLEFSATDAAGNEITKYADLTSLIHVTAPAGDTIEFVKQNDGTAKLVYTPAAGTLTGTNNETRVATFAANDSSSANYKIVTSQFKVYAAKVMKTITGIKTDQLTSVANVENDKITLKRDNLIVEDQYQNTLTKEEVAALDAVTPIKYTVANEGAGPRFTAVASTALGASKNIVVAANPVVGKATVNVSIDGASAGSYDFDIYTVEQTKATNLKIKSINDGNVVKIDNTVADVTTSSLDVNDIVVTGVVDGKTVAIPSSQYVISGDTFATVKKGVDGVEQKATLEVTVDTTDGTDPVTTVITGEYTYSNKAPALTTFDAANGLTAVSTASKKTRIDKTELIQGFEMLDQYGDPYAGSGVKYNVTIKSYNGTLSDLSIAHNNTNDVVISGGTATKVATVIVTATYGSKTETQTMDITFAN